MTAKTSQHLADTLRAAGFEDLAKRAEADEFHDFLSPHGLPELLLAEELATLQQRGYPAAKDIRERLIQGDFDASTEESEDWAKSADGQETFNRLIGGKS
jgi:hypothetical protein